MTVILREMDVVWVNPYRSGQSEPPVHTAWLALTGKPRSPNFGRDSRSASYPVDNVHQAGSHRALEDGDNVCREQKEGSVEVPRQYLSR